jgi:asparagine synthetase B (glutamine-hydrolysing)
MMLDGSPRNPNVVSRRLGDSLIAVNLKSNRMLELNVTAARTFELFQGGMTIDEVVDKLKQEFAEVPIDVEAEVRELVAVFDREGLLTTPPSIVKADEARPRDTEAWILRWDFETPFPDISGAPQIRREPNGDVTLFDGWLADEDSVSFPERWDTLRGAFVIARARIEAKELVIRRDPTGGWPCYYAFDGRVVLFASHLNVLLRRLGTKKFNPVHVAEWVYGISNDVQLRETLFDGVKRLPAGHELTLRREHESIRVTWEPLPAGFAWARPEEESQLMPSLERAVARALGSGAGAVALSGGYDSVTLALMAHRQKGDRQPLHAFSVHFAGTACDEGAIQTRVAKALGMPLHLEPLDLSASDELVDRALIQSGASSFPILSLWQGLYSPLFAQARPLGVTKVFLGTGGDEMFIVDPCYATDLLRRRELGELAHLARAWMRTSPFSSRHVLTELLWRESLRPILRDAAVGLAEQRAPALLSAWRRRRGLGPRVSDDLAGQLASRRRDESVAPEGAYVAAIRAMYRSPVMAASLDQGWEWARRFGVVPVLPFYDQDVVALALRMPPRALYAAGYMKTPLRRFVQQELPSITFPRKKVDFTAVALSVLRRGTARAWQRLGGVPLLASLGAIDHPWADDFMRRWMRGEERRWQLAWALLSTEAWLQAHAGQ